MTPHLGEKRVPDQGLTFFAQIDRRLIVRFWNVVLRGYDQRPPAIVPASFKGRRLRVVQILLLEALTCHLFDQGGHTSGVSPPKLQCFFMGSRSSRQAEGPPPSGWLDESFLCV